MGLFDNLFGSSEEQPLQLSGPVDPNAMQVDYGQPSLGQAGQSRPNVGGGDFAKGLAHAYSAGASFGQGDPNYLMRFERQMQAQRAVDQRDRALDQQQIRDLPQTISALEMLRDNIDESKKETVIPQIQKFFEKSGLPPEMISEMLQKGSYAIERFNSQYKFAENYLDDNEKRSLWRQIKAGQGDKVDKRMSQIALNVTSRAIREGRDDIPENAIEAMNADDRKNFGDRASQAVEERVGNVLQSGLLNKAATQEQFEQVIGKNARYLSKDAWTRINAKLPNVMGAEQLVEERKEAKKVEGEKRRDEIRDANTAQSQAFQMDKMMQGLGTISANTQAQINAQNARFEESEARRRQEEDRRERQQRRLTPVQERELSAMRNSVDMIDSYQKAHDDLMKETKGKVSAVLKGALAKNSKATTLAQITNISGNTPAEREFAAQFNSMFANIRQMANEPGVMTEQDAVRLLQSYDPATTPEQFRANVSARRKVQTGLLNRRTENLREMGKDVPSGLDAPSQPTTQTRPRATNPQTGEVVEWDGKAWVKVK